MSRQKAFIVFLTCMLAGITAQSQIVRTQPVWWFGQSGAANFNSYRGTTQMLNQNLTVPTAFHKGNGIRPYASVLTEYRPNKQWGGMLNIAFDNRGGKFDEVLAPCNCPANLSTNISYLTVEPGLRFAPFSSSFYLFAGPTLSFNVSKSFTYQQEKQNDKRGDWSDIRKTVFSAQAGAGIDIPLSARESATQFNLSPFVSFHTDLGNPPRSTESWSLYTIRTGIALKFGTSKKSNTTTKSLNPVTPVNIEKEVAFSVRAPKLVPLNRQVKETFPLRNSVFFDIGSSELPDRYVVLNNAQALSFREEQLQQSQPENLKYGRASRQLAVYHNILNIMGDRMRANPNSSILLTGASDNNPTEGKLMAENIKQYLVSVFGIAASRIATTGRDKPLVPSEQSGAVKELDLLREGDRRVDIESTSTELLLQVGGSNLGLLKPVQIIAVQEDPLDSHVIFNVSGADELLRSWSVEVTDEQGLVQQYGPYTKEQASVPAKSILGNRTQGNYKIFMLGQTKSGKSVKKESFVSLMKANDAKQEGLRYSILFDFNKSSTIDTYEKFLVDIISPLITENSIVIIHGHTDNIGEEEHNYTLSFDRSLSTQKVLERTMLKMGKKGVQFESFGFGEAAGTAPFENNLPEGRFYNRTVIIDIIPAR